MPYGVAFGLSGAKKFPPHTPLNFRFIFIPYDTSKAKKSAGNPGLDPNFHKEEKIMEERKDWTNETEETKDTDAEGMQDTAGGANETTASAQNTGAGATTEEPRKWYQRLGSPRRWKQAGAVLVLPAILGVGGHAYTYYRHDVARAEAMEARSKILTSLVAKENIQLVTPEQARQSVAEALGTDAGSLQVQSVLLETTNRYDGPWQQKGRPAGQKEWQKFHHDRDGRRGSWNQRSLQGGRGACWNGDAPQGGQGACWNGDAPQGVQGFRGNGYPAGDLSNSPLFYKVRATHDGAETEFLLDARSGKVLRVGVAPERSLWDRVFYPVLWPSHRWAR